MDMSNYRKLSRKQLLEAFELERQEWLAIGMSEELIYRIHFGKPGDKEHGGDGGRGGDYGVWLSERRHTRADHKYAPGTPVAIDAVDPDNAWISGGRGGVDEVEARNDIESAIMTLPPAQRNLMRAIVFGGLTSAEYAREKNINKSVVSRTLERARKNLKKVFSEGN